ncbi:kinase-like domain-containing protein [Boletus reticuloceps]|uniref:Kinase-like domain-containing protein n=1 Tax=Boletus reticuloceps TaxID=495285 RepID=A0A8I2YMZ0_9AGAM|nr:kinase-like domain-containing protein [Boletus reticuloceps]
MTSTTAREAGLDAQLSKRELEVWGTNVHLRPEELDPREVWWRDRYQQLHIRGHRLRARYSPEWVPSWTTSNKNWEDCEDGKRLEVWVLFFFFTTDSHKFASQYGQVIDATRISDGKVVTLKRINKTEHPYEVDIGLYFSSKALASLPANHCVPIYDVFTLDDDENITIMVMPLFRPYTNPRFDTVGEVVECFRQLFEGLQFMHKHRVAHRDCMHRNLMLDPTRLYPKLFHPVERNMNEDCKGIAKHFTRTQRPPKYYFIDFGISRQYDPAITDPMEIPIWGGDKEVPEFQNSHGPCDPFPTDVFYIGNAIRKDFILRKLGFEFMKPLVADMTQPDPAKRPTMDEVVARFDDIRRGLSYRKLRSRVVDVDEDLYERVVRTASHWKRRIEFVARRVPAVPSVSP